jgi:protein gp37
MSNNTKIEWTLASWNPVTGCTRVSPGCAHCYAERMAHRLQLIGQDKYKNGFRVTLHEDTLNLPLTWKKPRQIFVNSMGDLFHKDVPIAFIRKVFATMQRADWHVYQLLTKRSERMLSLAPRLTWPENLWMGVTCESSDYTYRLEHLQAIPCAVRFVSMEPLLGSIKTFPVNKIDWIIVGGESGPGARPMEKKWVYEIKERCDRYQIPFFFKQWGGSRRKDSGCLLDGKLYQEMPPLKSIDSVYALPLK